MERSGSSKLQRKEWMSRVLDFLLQLVVILYVSRSIALRNRNFTLLRLGRSLSISRLMDGMKISPQRWFIKCIILRLHLRLQLNRQETKRSFDRLKISFDKRFIAKAAQCHWSKRDDRLITSGEQTSRSRSQQPTGGRTIAMLRTPPIIPQWFTI